MKILKTVSLSPLLTNEELESEGIKVTSFLSFSRAIRESEAFNNMRRSIKGYQITEDGIILILE